MIISLMSQDSKPSRLPPMDGEVFPQLNPPPPEPLRVEELDDRAKARQEKKMLDFVRDKVRSPAMSCDESLYSSTLGSR